MTRGRLRIRLLLSLLTIASVLTAGLSAAQAGPAGTVAVRAEVGTVERAGVDADFFERYGSYEWAVVDESSLDALRRAGRIEVRHDAGTLVLPAETFDPVAGVPSGDALALEEERPAIHLVQFHGPIKDAWLADLRSLGAEVVQYLAPFTYAVLLDPADAAGVGALRPVRWVGAFHPAWRFGDLDLSGATGLNVVLLDDGRVRESLDLLAALEVPARVTARDLPYDDVSATGIQVPGRTDLAALAALPNVWSISPQRAGKARGEMSSQIAAGNYDENGVPQDGYTDWLGAQGITGDGVIVAHVDDGYGTAHPDNALTVAGCRDYGVPNGACVAQAGTQSDFHGQHTGGIIVGTGTAPLEGSDGFRPGQGVAPGAKLFVQNFISLRARFRPSGPGQYLELNKHSVLGEATISANSWGPSGSPQGYDADTREFDHAPRDADLDTEEHEPLAFVLSIMNGGGGTSTQGSPDEGKNLIHVGSSKNHRKGDIDDLAGSTAHGPMLDGRRLVDVVAPGEGVISTATPATVGLCLDPVVGPGAALYSGCNGTSMASPHVSGAAALFTEWYRERTGGEDPSPALMKAAFVNGAVDLAGARDADGKPLGHIPDDKQGWGRLNLSNVFGRTDKAYVNQSVLLGDSGQSWTSAIEPVDPALPVKVTLVWTDAPGHGLGGDTPAWVNDLDLRVTAGETTYLGNVFGNPSTGWSQPGGAADFMNNVENVFLQEAGEPLTVEVLAANLPGDGVPGNGDDTDQDFALVVSNGTFVQ